MDEYGEITSVSKETIAKNIASGVLKSDEGKVYLAFYLDEAEEAYRAGTEALTQAVLTLNFIRRSRLWSFVYDRWEDCLNAFIEERGKGKRSTWFDLLSFARQLSALPGWKDEDIARFADGIETFKPLFKGPNAIVASHDRQTGEIKEFANGWEERLPPAETKEARLALWINENVAEEDTAAVVRAKLKHDAPVKDCIEFGILFADGKPDRLFWKMELVGEEYQDGAIQISWSSLPPRVMLEMCKKLGIPEWHQR